MNEIVKISTSIIGNEEINSVNARDIHSYLEVKTRFNDWINRVIEKYDFKENIDFYSFLSKTSGRPEKEYIVSLDMAKELAMLENNSKGKEIRKYFINIEKDYFNSLKQNSNIKELKEQGFTTRQIANMINRSGSGVHNFLKRLNKDTQC